MSWCTSGVVLQVLPFIDNNHLGSTLRFHRFSCLHQMVEPYWEDCGYCSLLGFNTINHLHTLTIKV